MRELLAKALDTARSKGAQYPDIRWRKSEREIIYTRNDVLKAFDNSEESGVGIRVLKDGRWGFASIPSLKAEDIERTAVKAVSIAESAGIVRQKPIVLTEDKPQQGIFKTPIEKDPFKIPFKEKVELLYAIHGKTSKNPLIKVTTGYLYFTRFNQIFLSTEGADLENTINHSGGFYTATAVDKGDFQSRSFQTWIKGAGYEWIESQAYLEEAERIAEEAVIKINAPKSPRGKMDLVLLPSHLVLTIHESVGHPTELDRVLGWEANMAGTSFATTEKLGNFRYGSPLVNLKADNTLPGGLATWGWDDDGIPSKAWRIVKDGILVNYGTTRDVAHYIGAEESMGCNRADSYSSQPINRIPNLSLMPGKEKTTLEDIISDTEEGILIDGRGSFSIDQRRYNFQFGGDFFQKIENGKITGPLKDVTYQAITPQFWGSMDKIADERFWEPWGITNCGKGEPMQSMQMSHGSAPARFRNIEVGGALNG